MDVEFEEMEKRIRYGRNGTVDVGFNTIMKFEWEAGFIACHERDVLKVVLGILNMFAGLTRDCISLAGMASKGVAAQETLNRKG
jgi:hypothetical protein